MCTSLHLILFLISSPAALAQDILPAPSTFTTRASVTMPPAASLDSISTSVLSPISPVNPNQPPLQTFPELFIATEQTPQGSVGKNRVFNYYFLFLALLAAILAALLWWMHRQRRREREQTRLRGQHALVRDVERWTMYRRRQAPVVEGLNESGEAPPPYQPKDDTVTTPEHFTDAMDGAGSITIPPRALSRNDTGHVLLPDYSESVQIDNSNMDIPPTREHNETTSTRVGST